MRRLIIFAIALLVLGGLGAAAYPSLYAYWKTHNGSAFRHATVTKGEIVSVVNSSGTVQPVLNVQIGAFVSGPIVESNVDFNSRVKKGELLARIDERIYAANVLRDEASLAHAKADVARATALLQQAINDHERAIKLREEDKDYIADTEMDQYKFARSSFEAQLELSHASVKQAEANLVLSRANVEYTKILSPVDGIVTDRKIDPGQTVAAQFQTPVLFVVAPQMEEKMHVYAAVDESEIGLIRDAKERAQPVLFTVDAYPDDMFTGEIYQIRLNPTTTQNVVTYTVVVQAPNAELKLLPGMTASLSFQLEKRSEIVKIPNAALRFYPNTIEWIREADRKLIERTDDVDELPADEIRRSASEKFDAAKNRNRRHVWVEENKLLKAVEVITGVSDNGFTEMVSGPLVEGQQLVTGRKPAGT